MDINQPKILITGNEIGGQMQLMVEAFRKKGLSAVAATLDYNDFRDYNNDIKFILKNRRDKNSRSLFFLWALTYFDVFHFIGFGSWFICSLWRINR